MNRPHPRPQKGQRYRARKELAVQGVVTYSMPYTGSFQGILPAGEVLMVEHDPPPSATGALLQPENYALLESRLIPEADRAHPKYDSFAISISLESLHRNFELLDDPDDS